MTFKATARIVILALSLLAVPSGQFGKEVDRVMNEQIETVIVGGGQAGLAMATT